MKPKLYKKKYKYKFSPAAVRRRELHARLCNSVDGSSVKDCSASLLNYPNTQF